MANKSFVVQYLIKARDSFSADAEKVRKSAGKMLVAVGKLKKESAAMSSKSIALRNDIRSVVPVTSALSTKSDALAKVMRRFKPPRALQTTSSLFSELNAKALRLKATLKGVEDRFEGLSTIGKKVRNTGVAMTAALTLPAMFMFNSLKNAARDAEETRSKFATVFKDIGPDAEAMADKLANSYGLAGTKSRELMGDTGDLLTGFGFSQKAALDLSNKVNELAVDLASFTNFSGGAEGASAALTKALLGERESLKSLGIAILEKDVLAKVALMRSKGQRFETLRQAKAQATLAIAMEQSKNAIGDFSRTSESLANQERITAARILDMKEAFGKHLLPVSLLITKTIRHVAEAFTALSPGAKTTVLVIGAILAVVGPLLLVFGSLILALPMLTAGFAAFGAVAALAMGPLGTLAGVLAFAAVAVIHNWDKVRAFFSGFATGIQDSFGPATTRIIDQFTEAAAIIASLFSSDSEAAQSLVGFGQIGELMGNIVGGVLDLILRGLSGIGAIIGQVIAAVVNLDFSQFDIEAIKAEFLGAQAEPLLAQTRVDVGVNVGLDKGLTQTNTANVTATGARRTDVGVMQ